MNILKISILSIVLLGCQSTNVKKYQSGQTSSQFTLKDVKVYSRYGERERIENKKVFQTYYKNGQQKCETIVEKNENEEPNYCHFEWYENGVVKKESEIEFLMPRPSSEIYFSPDGKKIEEKEYEMGKLYVAKKYNLLGGLIEKNKFYFDKLTTREKFSFSSVKILLEEYDMFDGRLKLKKQWFESGSKKLEKYFNSSGEPEKEFSWDQDGNALPTWYTKKLNEQKLAKKRREKSKQEESNHRRELYRINHEWSEDAVRSKYRKSGGYCTSNETNYRNGLNNVQLVCNLFGSRHKYYYFKNGVMTAIQN